MQKDFVGKGSIEKLPGLLNDHSVRSILLVTGKKSFALSGAKKLLFPMFENCKVVQFSDFDVNPKLKDAIRGVQLVNKEQPDVIIAIGGGSAIDMAKLINSLAAQEKQDFLSLAVGETKIVKKGLPLFAIPTTSGTGSESTHFAVVYVEGKKYSLAHENILPEYAIVDPVFTYDASSYLTAVVGMDALSQAIESYWAVKSNEESKKFAAKAISMIFPALVDAVSGVHKARDIVSEAAHFAGKAINITTTTAAHAISYPITTYFNVPHGHAVALTLGKFFVINSDVTRNDVVDSRGQEYLLKTMNQLYSFFNEDSALGCRSAWYKLMKKIGMETSMSNLGIQTKDDVSKIINDVNFQRLSNNPVRVTENLLQSILV